MFKRFLPFLIILLLFTACSNNSSKSDDSTLQIAVSQEPATLDVMRNSSRVTRAILCGNVFERVLTLNKEGEATGELASSYSFSEDGKVLKIKLRDGVRFHNGDVMDEEDVVLSLNRWIDNYEAVRSIVGESRFKTNEELSIIIEGEKSLILLPDMMAGSPYSAVVMPKEVFSTLDEKGFITEVIGTGPYRFSSWNNGQFIRLDRFDDYTPYGDKDKEMDGLAGYKNAYIYTLIYNFVPDSVTRTAGIKAGQYYFDDDTVNDDREALKEDSSLVVSEGEEDGSVVLVFNKKEGLASHKYIRKAINTALDLDLIMRARNGKDGYVLYPGYMESWQKEWAVSNLEAYYNINDKEEAKRILEENGYDGTTFRILTSNSSNMDRAAVAIKSELEKIGMNVELIIADWSGMMSMRSDSSKYDMFITAMTQVAIPTQKLFLTPSYPGWSSDKKLSSLLSQFSNATTREEASALWEKIQLYCFDYLPAIVAGHYVSGSLYRKELVGVEEYFGYYFYNAKIVKE